MPRRTTHRSPWLFLRNRFRVGVSRTRSSFAPALQMTIGAVGAYAFAEYVMGHEGPLFAATSAMIALGFTREPRLRRVIEVAAGCTLGIAVGDLLLHTFGTGIWVAAGVLLFSILLARFLDSGSIFTTQLGLQSLLVVLLPVPLGGPFTRSLDAVVGGVIALAITLLVPRDPRREPKTNVRALLSELSAVLRECADSLRESDATQAWHALVRARNCQPLLDGLSGSMRQAQEVTLLSPAYRRHRGELGSLRDTIYFLDLAVRNSRVFARRLTSVINHAALTEEAVNHLAEALYDMADAVGILSQALSDPAAGTRNRYLRQARNDLAAVATMAHPRNLAITRLEGEALVLLLRPMIVDLLEAAGMRHEEATKYLPEL